MISNFPKKWDAETGLVGGTAMTHGWLAARYACGSASDRLREEAAQIGL